MRRKLKFTSLFRRGTIVYLLISLYSWLCILSSFITLLGIITVGLLTTGEIFDREKYGGILQNPPHYPGRFFTSDQPFIFKIQKLRIFSVSDLNFQSWDDHENKFLSPQFGIWWYSTEIMQFEPNYVEISTTSVPMESSRECKTNIKTWGPLPLSWVGGIYYGWSNFWPGKIWRNFRKSANLSRS